MGQLQGPVAGARRRQGRSKTLSPFSMSDGCENSLGAWLIPATLGINIMPMGPTLAISWASCPAPLGMSLVENFRRSAVAVMTACSDLSVSAGALTSLGEK